MDAIGMGELLASGSESGGPGGGLEVTMKNQRVSSSRSRHAHLDSEQANSIEGHEEMNVEQLQAVMKSYSHPNFDEIKWVDHFFRTHLSTEAEDACKDIARWQKIVQDGLKDAVLNRYKYFVEASKEMTQSCLSDLACRSKYVPVYVIESLIDTYPRSVKKTHSRKLIPLHHAVASSRFEVVELLLRYNPTGATRPTCFNIPHDIDYALIR